MGQDFFTYLPPEIVIGILSRLPVRTTITCKCVCKSWLELVETLEFAKSHLSKSDPGLAVYQGSSCFAPYKYFQYVDDPRPETEHRCSLVFNFGLPDFKLMHSSVDGLLLLYDHKIRPHDLLICNPITRDYIKIPCPQEISSYKHQLQLDTFGFGVSKTSGQYKLVRVYHDHLPIRESDLIDLPNQSRCQVYTLGTGSWRNIEPSSLLKYEYNTVGAYLNGNFHWLASGGPEQSLCVSCFDLDTELFTSFPSPRLGNDHDFKLLSALKGCLCLCDNSGDGEIVIWSMKRYGDGKSWAREFIIRKEYLGFGVLCPIKIYEDGEVLIAKEDFYNTRLLRYSGKTGSIQATSLIPSHVSVRTSAVSYTPSFLALKTFINENVTSF